MGKYNNLNEQEMKKIILSILLSLSLACCSNKNTPSEKEININELKEPLIEANKKMAKNESEIINRYIARHHLVMKETGTGLRYWIDEKGSGEKAKNGQLAKVNFKVWLLDGTLCYSSEKTGAKEFLIGQDNVVSGLHEGIAYMRVGGKAKFIIPSHLAYGLIGDDDKIPFHATIIYDIELLSLR